MLDLELSTNPISEERVEEVFELVKTSELSENIKQSFSQRRLDFLEDFSSNINKILKANEAHSKLYKTKQSSSNGTSVAKKRPAETK